MCDDGDHNGEGGYFYLLRLKKSMFVTSYVPRKHGREDGVGAACTDEKKEWVPHARTRRRSGRRLCDGYIVLFIVIGA